MAGRCSSKIGCFFFLLYENTPLHLSTGSTFCCPASCPYRQLTKICCGHLRQCDSIIPVTSNSNWRANCLRSGRTVRAYPNLSLVANSHRCDRMRQCGLGFVQLPASYKCWPVCKPWLMMYLSTISLALDCHSSVRVLLSSNMRWFIGSRGTQSTSRVIS